MKVAVLKGGRSLERGVSLRSGARVEDALERLGHEVVAARRRRRPGQAAARRAARRRLRRHARRGGEDGTAQELLEILGIPFTGPGAAACARCIDKVLAKHAMREAGHPDPRLVRLQPDRLPRARRRRRAGRGSRSASASRWWSSRAAAAPRSASGSPPAPARFPRRWSPPSATTTGSCSSASSTGASWRSACSAASRCRSSRRSRRRATATTSRPATRSAAPASSARPSSTATERAAVTEAALGAYRALGCSGFARVDLILAEDGPQVLEVNAIPGLTDTSLLPQAAEAAGMSFEELVETDPRPGARRRAASKRPRPGRSLPG